MPEEVLLKRTGGCEFRLGLGGACVRLGQNGFEPLEEGGAVGGGEKLLALIGAIPSGLR